MSKHGIQRRQRLGRGGGVHAARVVATPEDDWRDD